MNSMNSMNSMRIPDYISPTSLSLWITDRSEFYLKYLAEERPPRMPQTQPMSVGSGFDAYVKNYLVTKLKGKTVADSTGFKLIPLFKEQVEKHNQVWAWPAGKHVFESYVRSGACADLMRELEAAQPGIRFEFKIERRIPHQSCIEGIPVLGKPDVFFTTQGGVQVILDWKVNGYCSKSNTSPAKGYSTVRDGWLVDPLVDCGGKHSRNHAVAHKGYVQLAVKDITVNGAITIDQVNESWARQLTMYAWVLGVPVGQEFVAWIEQLVCGSGGSGKPQIRVASHRSLISESYQFELYEQLKNCWLQIQRGHIFDDLSLDDSRARCLVLDQVHTAYNGDDPRDKQFADMTRQYRNF